MASKLEEIGLNQRGVLTPFNTYNNSSNSREYSATHTRALSDQETPVNGKGTGIFLDTFNGGGSLDINGSSNAAGSGRIANVASNQFDNDNQYVHPDTTGNVGQFRFH